MMFVSVVTVVTFVLVLINFMYTISRKDTDRYFYERLSRNSREHTSDLINNLRIDFYRSLGDLQRQILILREDNNVSNSK